MMKPKAKSTSAHPKKIAAPPFKATASPKLVVTPINTGAAGVGLNRQPTVPPNLRVALDYDRGK